jgi:3,4-dihydroxy 2-butanone 4-phosphate synthase/GTP cyclohydrolase II
VKAVSDSQFLSSIEELIEEARQGRMFILMDDEGRENEGDLVLPAAHATPEAINFMARFGRGLICLALTRDRVNELGLPLMAQMNRSRHETAFTVSIEAREGITTGISAADRARTIAVAIDPEKGRDDVVTPGHVFPLVARDGGVLVRAGHTEAAVDIARMAGLNPSGVICEIMNDDGTMARLPDVMKFAQFHGLKVGTIADLIAYRRRSEKMVERVVEDTLTNAVGGEFKVIIYASKLGYSEHIALVKGDPSAPGPCLVRMHSVNAFDDLLLEHDDRSPGALVHGAMRQIAEAGRGVIVLIREASPTFLSDRLRGKSEITSLDSANHLRHYGIGAQILVDLGVTEMILLSNSKRNIVGLDGYGLTVLEQRPLKIGTE